MTDSQLKAGELVFGLNSQVFSAGEEETTIDTLVNTVKQRIAPEEMPSVPFSKLTSLATRREKFTLVLGWFFAFLTGSALPCFIWTIGDVFNSFDPKYTPEETQDRVRVIFGAIIALSIFLICTATLQY